VVCAEKQLLKINKILPIQANELRLLRTLTVF